jgi:hypothetical protein
MSEWSSEGTASGSEYGTGDATTTTEESSWWDEAAQAVEDTYDQAVEAVEQAYDAAVQGQAADDFGQPTPEQPQEAGMGVHVTVHLVEHVLMHKFIRGGVFGPASTLLFGYDAYCAFFAPCTEEERTELDRQYYEWYHECYPEIVAAGNGSTTRLWAAGCEADHGGASWSGPYRISREDAAADLQAHLAEWPDHEIISNEGDVEPTDQGTFVAGCDADHGGSSWSGPERADMNEAVADLEQHLAEWPDHRINSETGQPGASVKQVSGW